MGSQGSPVTQWPKCFRELQTISTLQRWDLRLPMFQNSRWRAVHPAKIRVWVVGVYCYQLHKYISIYHYLSIHGYKHICVQWKSCTYMNRCSINTNPQQTNEKRNLPTEMIASCSRCSPRPAHWMEMSGHEATPLLKSTCFGLQDAVCSMHLSNSLRQDATSSREQLKDLSTLRAVTTGGGCSLFRSFTGNPKKAIFLKAKKSWWIPTLCQDLPGCH